MERPNKLEGLKNLVKDLAQAGRIAYSHHANKRLAERKVVKPEVEYVLIHGHHEARKDEFKEEFQSWDYAIRGKTVDGRELRIAVAIIQPNFLVVTVIDLGKED